MSWLGLGISILRNGTAAGVGRLLRRILQENGDFLLQEDNSKILY